MRASGGVSSRPVGATKRSARAGRPSCFPAFGSCASGRPATPLVTGRSIGDASTVTRNHLGLMTGPSRGMRSRLWLRFSLAVLGQPLPGFLVGRLAGGVVSLEEADATVDALRGQRARLRAAPLV